LKINELFVFSGRSLEGFEGWFRTKEYKTEEREKMEEKERNEVVKQMNRKTQENMTRGVWNAGMKNTRTRIN